SRQRARPPAGSHDPRRRGRARDRRAWAPAVRAARIRPRAHRAVARLEPGAGPVREGGLMAHAYTPGLRIAHSATVVRERRLPLRGDVLVNPGDAVTADQVVARCELPGNVQTINLASRLAVDPARAASALLKPIGSRVEAGEPIAEGKSLFGLVRQRVV